VGVLGHDDEGPEVVAVLVAGAVEGVEEPAAAAVAVQEGLPAEAGEGEGMGVARFLRTRFRWVIG
jgi:hypothetical protein